MADTILSLLEPGEYVLNRNAVDKLGKKALDKINYKEAPRFPDKSILADYFNQQRVPDFWSGMYGSLSRGKPKKKSKKALGSPSRPSIPVPMDEEGMLGDVALGNLEFDDIDEQNIPQMSLDDAIWGDTDEDFARALDVEGYQDGGSVSYGGYESEEPTLEGLYEMFGVEPKGEYASRFQEYDPAREGIYHADYQTALDKAQTTGQRGMEQLYEGTAGVGGFAGSGAAEKARGRGRKSLMEDYLGGQKSAYSSLFKGVRDERERWLKEMGGQLSTLEGTEGTDPYKKTHTPTVDDSVVPSDDPTWSPPDPTGQGMVYPFQGNNYYWDGSSWLTQQQWDDTGLSSASGDV